MATLANARYFLSRYGGQGNSFVDRLNFAIARLLPEVNSRGTKVPAQFVVYKDERGNRFVTLPRELEAILAGAYQAPSPDVNGPQWFWCGQPIPIRNDWYQYAPAGPGNADGSDWQRGIIPMPGRFTTFCDWSEPMRLKIVPERPEIAGNILIRGELDNSKIYSQDSGGNWIEGVSINFTNVPVTTTQTFQRPPYEIVKTVTQGRLFFYMVDALNVATLVGLYEPDETNPSYKRYKIPVCETTGP